MADKGLDPQIATALMEIIESTLAKVPGLAQTSPAENVEKDIVEYEHRIRVNSYEKLQAPAYISYVNFYLSEAEVGRTGKAKGALILYFDIENSGKFYKAVGLPFPDDEDDASMLNCNGEFCKLLAEGLKAKLVEMGYASLAISTPSSYRSNVVDGVEYSPDQKKLQELSFFYFKHKTIVVELTLGAIPTKR